MTQVQGLWQRDGFDAGELAEILGARTDELHWLVDVQSGNFNLPQMEKLGDEDALIERYLLSIDALKNTSTQALRPGAVSRLGPAMNWDEQSYLVGFFAAENEVEALINSTSLETLARWFWRIFQNQGGIYVEDIDDGLAFTFTTQPEWFDLLQAARPQAKPISVEQWQQRHFLE